MIAAVIWAAGEVPPRRVYSDMRSLPIARTKLPGCNRKEPTLLYGDNRRLCAPISDA